MTDITNLHTTATVHDEGDRYTESGARVPAAEVRATEIAEQAGHWLVLATERTRMCPPTLLAKALASATFSTLHKTASLAVPSKLSGTSGHQRALWALVREPAQPWARLDLDATGDGLAASYDGAVLGLVQTKHLGWVQPLLGFGLTLHLARVTGHDYDGYSLGANVCFGHVGLALIRLHDALSGPQTLPADLSGADLASGDGAAHRPLPELSERVQADASKAGGDGAAGGLRLVVSDGLVVRPERDAVRPGAAPDDVVMYRRLDGTACASVSHVVQHSPGGIDWGRTGSGPADLAYSVLCAIADETTASRLYGLFEAEVVVRVPYAGGVLRAVDVRAWIARHTS